MVVKKMKEKCKESARRRREKERTEFTELSKLLPLPSSTTSQLDKASIIRLTSTYLRMRADFPKGLGENWGTNISGSRSTAERRLLSNDEMQPHQQIRELGSLILQTLDGFVFALHKDGKIMYISETASVHLGLPQIDLTGASIFEHVHPADHQDLSEMLALNESDRAQLERQQQPNETSSDESGGEIGRSFCIRMKCILPKRNAGLVTSGYKAIHCNGYLKLRRTAVSTNNDAAGKQETTTGGGGEWESYALVAVGHSLLPTASTEVKLASNSFMFRASLDLTLYFVESQVSKLLGFEPADMIGQSLYQFVHVGDTSSIEQSHRSLLDKGQVVSKYYRVMRKTGGYIWLQSYATLVSNPRNMPKHQHIVCICFVLGANPLDQSRIIDIRTQVSDCQIAASGTKSSLSSAGSITSSQSAHLDNSGSLRAQSRTDKLATTAAAKRHRKLKSAVAHVGTLQLPATGRLRCSGNAGSAASATKRALKQPHYDCAACHPPTTTSTTTDSTINDQHLTMLCASRRASDDTCSVVSSVASTSLCSSLASLSSSSGGAATSTGLVSSSSSSDFAAYYTSGLGGQQQQAAATLNTGAHNQLTNLQTSNHYSSSADSSTFSPQQQQQLPSKHQAFTTGLLTLIDDRQHYQPHQNHQLTTYHHHSAAPDERSSTTSVIQQPSMRIDHAEQACWSISSSARTDDELEDSAAQMLICEPPTSAQVGATYVQQQQALGGCSANSLYFQTSPDLLVQQDTNNNHLPTNLFTTTCQQQPISGCLSIAADPLATYGISHCDHLTSSLHYHHEPSPPYFTASDTGSTHHYPHMNHHHLQSSQQHLMLNGGYNTMSTSI